MTHRVRGWLPCVGAGLTLVLAGCRHATMTSGASSSALAAAEATPSFPREPSAADPVVAVGKLVPARLKPGDRATLVIHVRTAATWHIYAYDATGTANTPAALTLTLPLGVERVGEWRQPTSHPNQASSVPVLEGSFAFQCELGIAPDATPGSHEFACDLAYQACDPLMCRPPERLTVRVMMDIVAR